MELYIQRLKDRKANGMAKIFVASKGDCFIWKYKRRIAVLLFVCGVIWWGAYSFQLVNNPFKVIDPQKPSFVLRNFRITDYKTGSEFNEALIKLFPVGTPRHVVDTVMILGGAKPTEINQYPWQTNYSFRWRLNWLIPSDGHSIIVFDDNDKLLNIHPSGGKKLYPNSLGKDEIRAQKEAKHDNP